MKNNFLWLLLLSVAGLSACKKEVKTIALNPPLYPTQNDSVDFLKINQIQVIGSHNSYRTRTYEPLYNLAMDFYSQGILPQDLSPQGWDYNHVLLPQQLGAFGMRGIELDVYEDVQGGRFYNRGGKFLVGESTESNIPELNQPGFKILHIPDFDYNTNYYSFVSALQAVKSWSDQNPNHIPIFINIESKLSTLKDYVDMPFFVPSQPYDAASADAIDAEIKSVFGASLDKVITPDDIRGNYATLRAAVLAGNWPTLGEARGKVIFIMEGSMVSLYKQGHPSLQGRIMFTYSLPNADEAAFVIYNDPVDDMVDIQQATAQGFIVRTRSDWDTKQARTGDYSIMNAAFESGAQIISTDYYQPDPRYKTEAGWTSYQVAFPGGITYRINPVTASNKVFLGPIAE